MNQGPPACRADVLTTTPSRLHRVVVVSRKSRDGVVVITSSGKQEARGSIPGPCVTDFERYFLFVYTKFQLTSNVI